MNEKILEAIEAEYSPEGSKDEDKDKENEDDIHQAMQEDREKLQGIDFRGDPLAYHRFAELIGNLSVYTITAVFRNIKMEDGEGIMPILMRFTSADLWKFMYFMLVCLDNLDPAYKGFHKVKATLNMYCDKILEKEKTKFTAFFRDLFISSYVDAVKRANRYEKREALIRLLYSFFPKDGLSRLEAVRLYKAKLDNMDIFIQSLAILITLEGTDGEGYKELKGDYKQYAKLAIKHKKVYVRLNGLLLMRRMVDFDYEWVQKIMVRYLDCLSPDEWWENRIMIVEVYTAILDRLTKTEMYLRHIKMKNSEMVKVITVENEMMIKAMKDTLEQISLGLAKVLSKNLNQDLMRIAMLCLATIMIESRMLVSIFVDLLIAASPELRYWILNEGIDFEGRHIKERFILNTQWSLSYRCSLDIEALKIAAGDILTEMANKIKALSSPSKFSSAHLDILVFCFNNTDFQKLNVEVTDILINSSLDAVLLRMQDPENCFNAREVLLKYLENFLREEVSVQDFEKRFAQMLVSTCNDRDETVIENMGEFMRRLGEEYTPDKALHEKFMKLSSRISPTVNRKTITDPEMADIVEGVFGIGYGTEGNNED